MKPYLLPILVVLVMTTACADVDARGADTRNTVDTRSIGDALALLHEWDHSRSLAWRDADLAALADLYTRTSLAGRHDRAMLAAYDARGLRVTGLRTQVLEASLQSWTEGRVRLEVTDRVVDACAVGPGGRIPLPRDRPTTRVISLRRVSGVWLVDEVTDVGLRRRPASRSRPGTGNPLPPARPGAG